MNRHVSSVMTLIVAPESSTVGGAHAAIPFRTEMPISTGSIAFGVLVTVLMLAVLVAVIAYARHRGWAGRWPTGMLLTKRPALDESIEVCATRRLSMATTTHVVRYRGHEYLIVESTRGVTAAVTPLGAAAAQSSEEP